MHTIRSERLEATRTNCSRCGQQMGMREAYPYKLEMLCEECCLDVRTPRVRKTDWQYIGSIKTEYLIQH